MLPRRDKILARLKQENLDGLLVSSAANISYLVNARSRDAYLLVSPKEAVYFTDSRYTLEAEKFLKNISLIKTNGSVFKSIADHSLKLGLRRLGFEGRFLPYAEYRKIKERLKGKAVLVSTHGLIEELRQIKEPQELAKIREAVAITAKAVKFLPKILSAGRREIEIAAELERFIRFAGASGAAFEIIVAAGANSCLPHHIPGGKRLQNNQPVLVDFGVDYAGYKSDLTRVFFLGKINSLERKIYQLVLDAQLRALKEIKAEVAAKEIDAAGRGFIASEGYGEFFGHNLGHGIGLEIHEQPTIGRNEEVKLSAGMVFTVEPAIYLPKKFGIRIEDMVVVSEKGCEVLSGAIDK
jgi:Xaa-Pro aminopeptidase